MIMKTKNLIFLFPLFVLFGCQKEADTGGEDPGTKTYTVVFTTLTCDRELNLNCQDVASKTITPIVEIYFFESEYEREEGELVFKNGVTDAGGKLSFTGLEAGDYFYTALHPHPHEVQNDVINHFVRISPNTYRVSEEVLFVGN